MHIGLLTLINDGPKPQRRKIVEIITNTHAVGSDLGIARNNLKREKYDLIIITKLDDDDASKLVDEESRFN